MNDWIELQADDGHRFRVFRSLPPEPPLGAVLVLQEIYGVNRHIRWIAEQVSAHGFAAYAPSLFDRITPGIELEYDEDGKARASELLSSFDFTAALRDVTATATNAAALGPVASLGFSMGGTLAYLCAARLSLPSVGYYGSRIRMFLDEAPKAPLLLHFGRRDELIPEALIEELKHRHPQLELQSYEAGHGFVCNERSDFHAPSAALAWRRTFAFLRTQLAEAPRFELHPTLGADCHVVADLALCRVLLMEDARYPWLILVPRVRNARELTDLMPADRHRLMDEITQVSEILQSICEPDKLNVATLGNRVAQLHIHVIARYERDAAWPDPVWGKGQRESYGEGQRRMLLGTLQAALRN